MIRSKEHHHIISQTQQSKDPYKKLEKKPERDRGYQPESIFDLEPANRYVRLK